MLERRCHWINAEIGCHIEIDRSSNIYETEAHAMMHFLMSELKIFHSSFFEFYCLKAFVITEEPR